jgi:hypothetical protein
LTGEQTGGSPILNYDLAWDQGKNDDSGVTHSTLQESDDGSGIIEATIDGLSSGFTYQFKYRAQNIHGWSINYSESTSVKTLTEPHAVSMPTTANVEDKVQIRWL